MIYVDVCVPEYFPSTRPHPRCLQQVIEQLRGPGVGGSLIQSATATNSCFRREDGRPDAPTLARSCCLATS